MKKSLDHIKELVEKHTRLIPIVGVLVLAIALPITVSLIEKNQDLRQRASGPQVVQVSPTDSPSDGTCVGVRGTCVLMSDWNSNPDICFGANPDGTYDCDADDTTPGDEGCCLLQSPPTTNSCTGQCHASESVCESNNPGKDCTTGTGSCTQAGTACFDIADPVSCPGQCHASESVCEDNNPGKDCTADTLFSCQQSGTTCYKLSTAYPPLGSACPDGSGNYSCGFGTSDTGCPVCSPINTCATDNYSIASCSGTATCTEDTDCSGRPASCPAGQSGTVVCQKPSGQATGSCVTVSCQ